MRWKATFLGLLAASATLASASQAKPAPKPTNLLGKVGPELEVTNWLNSGGATLSLQKLRGKVVVLDFWAYW